MKEISHVAHDHDRTRRRHDNRRLRAGSSSASAAPVNGSVVTVRVYESSTLLPVWYRPNITGIGIGITAGSGGKTSGCVVNVAVT